MFLGFLVKGWWFSFFWDLGFRVLGGLRFLGFRV